MKSDEMKNKSFDKGAFGYKVEDVHLYLNDVANYLENLENRNEQLERQIEALNARIVEYKTDEDSMKNIIVSAQKISTSVVNDAKTKADRIIAAAQTKSSALVSESSMRSAKMVKDAEKQAESLVAASRDQANVEQKRLETMQREVAQFKSHLLSIYKSHLDLITKLPEDEPNKPNANKVSAKMDSSKKTVEEPVKQDETRNNIAKPAEQPADPPNHDAPPVKSEVGTSPFKIVITEKEDKKAEFKSRFGELKFGEDSK